MKAVRFLILLVIIGVFHTIPADAGQLLNKLITVCTQGQNPPADLVQRYRNGEFPNDRNTHCMMRCIALNLGVYDDLNGIHMHDTWQMFRRGRPASHEKAFAEQHRQCITQQTKDVPLDDYCGRVYAVYQCYKDEYEALLRNVRQGAAKARN
ncbi:AAEL011730-PA [Aedes aegypti]|uniref:AAEL011730-PA n=1 Tax=Aedes aegypti TaxID=7159 RepID=Q16P85_AEDAE|nr:AAEL011730-PA [Aedes aegypti]